MSSGIMRKSQLDARELLILEQEVKSQGKNMVVAYVLWYFLGLFGGHRFYLGRTGTAITQLVLSITAVGMVITFIWWVIDAFLLHTWVKERNRYVEDKVMDQILAGKGNSSYIPSTVHSSYE